MAWMIQKKSRVATSPYCGPECKRAGVPRGLIYEHRGDAEHDAELLSAHNPVGFEVVEYVDSQPKK